MRGRKYSKYSPEFKQAAVDRFVAGESATALAKELGIRRKFLYAWRDAGFGSNATGKPKRESVVEDPQEKQIVELKQQVADLQRLAGQQAAELDFFALALCATKESHLPKRVISGIESIPQSKMS